MDSRSENISVNGLDAKFFNSHTPVVPLVLALNKYLQRENSKYHFLEKVVKQIGVSRWDKAIIVYGGGASYRGAADSANLTYIPFVRDSQNFVNACLLIQTTLDDTTYEYLCDWQYAEYGFDTASGDWNARDIFHIFSALDKEVFDRNEFKIVDERLLTPPEISAIEDDGSIFDSVEVHYILTPSLQGHGRNNFVTPVTFCENVTMCVIQGIACEGSRGNKTASTPGCCIAMTVEICTTEWVWIPSGGGGGGGGGGTGGGGNGNPQRSSLLNPCGPGGEPIPDPGGGGSPSPPNDSTIAENLKRLYLKGQTKADSLFTMAMTDTLERTFTFVKGVNHDTIPMFPKAGTKHTSSPTLAYNYFAIWHSHQDEGPANRNQCFDGPDIHKLYYHTINNETVGVSIITTKDYIYAAVITDPLKFRDYCRALAGGTENNERIRTKLNNLHIDAWDNCSCSWQQGSEAGTLAITANNNSSISGIKIFKSPRQNINFTLLTP